MKEKKLNDILASLRRASDTIEVSSKLFSMQNDLIHVTNPAMLEYAPIKIIACFEEYFRQLYKDIIDEPRFRMNLKNIKELKESKIDFDVIDAFQNNTITLGDYFSYSFPCSSLENINTNFSTLLGIDFFKILKENIIKDNTKSETMDVDSLIASIGTCFKMRHTLCHEASIITSLTQEKVQKMISNAIIFIEHIDKIVYNMIYPNAPETQAEMNEMEIQLFKQSDRELALIIDRIKELTKNTDFPETFGYLESWKAYRECRAKDDASSYEGGSIYPVIYYGSLDTTTRQFIIELKQKFKNKLTK